MEITMVDGRVVVTWPKYTEAVNSEIKIRLHRIAGVEFDWSLKAWTAPAAQADRLYAAFPKASYDYDVICAVVDAQAGRIGIFGQSLLNMGISLLVIDGRVMAYGDGVSPLLQAEIDARTDLLAWLQSRNASRLEITGQIGFADALQVQIPTNGITSDSRGVSAVSAETLRQAELLVNGMRNAAKNQYNEEAMRQSRQRRRYAKVK